LSPEQKKEFCLLKRLIFKNKGSLVLTNNNDELPPPPPDPEENNTLPTNPSDLDSV
jgi:hypothetical protein